MRGTVSIANGLAHRSTRDIPTSGGPRTGIAAPRANHRGSPRIITPQRQFRRDIPDRKTILVHQIARIISRVGRRSPCGDRVMVGCCVFTYGQAHRLLRRCPASAGRNLICENSFARGAAISVRCPASAGRNLMCAGCDFVYGVGILLIMDGINKV